MTLILLLLLPLIAVACTWLGWEAFCRYDSAVAPIGSYDTYCDQHECNGPATCPDAAAWRQRQYQSRREFRTIVTPLACGLAVMGVFLVRLAG